jgi:hypothetical protein
LDRLQKLLQAKRNEITDYELNCLDVFKLLEGKAGDNNLYNNFGNSSSSAADNEGGIMFDQDQQQQGSASSSASSSAAAESNNNVIAGSGYSQGEKAMPKTPRSAIRKPTMNPTPKSVRLVVQYLIVEQFALSRDICHKKKPGHHYLLSLMLE